MDNQILQTTIEFIKKATPENIVSDGAQTSDFMIWPWLIVLGIVAITFAGILLFKKLKTQNIQLNSPKFLGEISLSKKGIAIITSLILALAVIIAVTFTYSVSFADSQIDYKDNIQVVVDEENNTMEIPSSYIKNNTDTRIYFSISNAETLDSASKVKDLDKALITVNTQKGLLFKGPVDNSEFRAIECNPFDDSQQLNLNYSFENFTIEQAKELVDKGPVFQLNFSYYQNCLVTFDTQGIGKAPAMQEQYVGGPVQKPVDPTDTYYTFEGWYKEPTLEHPWDFENDKVEKNITLYAKWQLKFEKAFNERIVNNEQYKDLIDNDLIHVNVKTLDGSLDYSYGSPIAYTCHSDKKIISASLIKLLVVAHFIQEVDAGQIALDKVHYVDETDKSTWGTWHIAGMDLGAPVTYDELAKYSIMYSDNAACNVLIREFGVANINATANKLGLKNTQLGRLFIVETPPPDNFISADDAATILEKIYNNTLARKELCDKFQDYLLKQTDQDAMGHVFAENDISFGHKTANLASATPARHDSGIVYANKPFVISVAMEIPEGRANPIHAQISQIAIETLCQ